MERTETMLWRYGTILAAAFAAASLSIVHVAVSGAGDLELSIPADCDLGIDCFVQNYVDIDPSANVRSSDCNQASYDGHKGTDFRVPDIGYSVNVVASAPGTVKALRSDMPDRLVLSEEDRAHVRDKECGNGVVIAHENGWETQYCHLRQSSLVVVRGDKVKRGQKLGEIGYSGFAAFPHVHLSVRKDGKVVDPFLGDPELSGARLEACEAGEENALDPHAMIWQSNGEDLLKDAGGAIIQTGFADNTVSTLNLEQGKTTVPAADSSALVFFARLINLQKGDRVALRLVGPDGLLAETEGEPIDRNKAQWVAFSGRKLRSDSWPQGEYTGEVTLIRNGQALLKKTGRMSLGS